MSFIVFVHITHLAGNIPSTVSGRVEKRTKASMAWLIRVQGIALHAAA
jgi:hypothetical protein